jgi:hypothetical protein
MGRTLKAVPSRKWPIFRSNDITPEPDVTDLPSSGGARGPRSIPSRQADPRPSSTGIELAPPDQASKDGRPPNRWQDWQQILPQRGPDQSIEHPIIGFDLDHASSAPPLGAQMPFLWRMLSWLGFNAERNTPVMGDPAEAGDLHYVPVRENFNRTANAAASSPPIMPIAYRPLKFRRYPALHHEFMSWAQRYPLDRATIDTFGVHAANRIARFGAQPNMKSAYQPRLTMFRQAPTYSSQTPVILPDFESPYGGVY